MKNIEPDVIASINNLGFQHNSRHIFLEITNFFSVVGKRKITFFAWIYDVNIFSKRHYPVIYSTQI